MMQPCRAARIGMGIAAIVAALAGCRHDAPGKQQVVVYCSVDQEIAEPILAAVPAADGDSRGGAV